MGARRRAGAGIVAAGLGLGVGFSGAAWGQDRETTMAAKSQLRVTEKAGLVQVDTGAVVIEIDTARAGFISRVQAGEKTLSRGDGRAPVFAAVLESAEYDGIADYAPGRTLPATWKMERCAWGQEQERFTATTTGELAWDGGDALRCEIRMQAEAGSPHVQVSARFERKGEFRERFVREAGLQLPLTLNARTRVAQGGDRGVRFDTRARYEFHVHVAPLSEPDRNYWQHFWVEQPTAQDCHLWRSESLSTSGLSMFRGREAAGWMTAYDEQGGALMAYRGMSRRAPKSLYVNTLRESVARVYFHAPGQRALDLRSPGADSLLGRAHETDWVFFEGAEEKARPDRVLARAWKVETLPSDGPVRGDPVVEAIQLWPAPDAGAKGAPLVSSGLPLPKGAITEAGQVRLMQEGRERALQATPLAYWPDRTIKWLLLTFPLTPEESARVSPGQGTGTTLPFDVTLEGGAKAAYALQFGRDVRAGRVESPLTARTEGERVVIGTGPLEVAIGKGEQWLPSAKLNGREMIRGEAGPMAFSDFLRTERGYPAGTAHAEGQPDAGALWVEKVELEEAGPLRATVRLEGRTRSREPMRVVLRVEAYAGRSYLRLFHTAEFLHKDPRTTYLRRMGVRLPLTLEAASARTTAGTQDGPKALTGGERAGLRQASHLSYEAWTRQGGQRHRTPVDAGHRSRGWLDISDAGGGVTVFLRNMWQEFPKELTSDTRPPAVTAYLWPESSPLMDVRRYSNYPHRAQGESAGDDCFWVDTSYYPNDPFVGVSKTHEMLVWFHDATAGPAQMESLSGAFQRPALAYAGAKWYWDTKVVLPNVLPGDEARPLTDAGLRGVAAFWRFHQKYWGWYGMWDYGDVGHAYRTGYGRIVPVDELIRLTTLTPAERAAVDMKKLPQKQDYFTALDWAFDNGRWGWNNTEGLCGLFMQTEYLRSGDRDTYFFIEAMARHFRDVDMRHAGKWFGAGTRHGVQHWSDGDHEERQTVHSEFRFYHYLSGDMRCRDFAAQLTEGRYLKGVCWQHAQHSARLYGLLTRWEMTGDAALGETVRNYVRSMVVPEGLAQCAPVKFPEGTLAGKPAEVNASNMFFDNFGALHALLEYYELTEDPVLREGLTKYAREGEGPLKAAAFAVRHAADPAPYRRALADRLFTGRGFLQTLQTVSSNPAHWTGETGFLRGGVSGGLFWINDAGYVMYCMGGEPQLSERQSADLKRAEERGLIMKPAGLLGSWQSEYDRPELQKYLTPRRTLEP